VSFSRCIRLKPSVPSAGCPACTRRSAAAALVQFQQRWDHHQGSHHHQRWVHQGWSERLSLQHQGQCRVGLSRLDRMNPLSGLHCLDRLVCLHRYDRLNRLERYDRLNHLNCLERYDRLNRLDRLDRLNCSGVHRFQRLHVRVQNVRGGDYLGGPSGSEPG